MNKTCQHYYWKNNLQHNYRRCSFCGLTQYNYTGKWENEISIEDCIGKYLFMGGGTDDYSEVVTIKVAYPFEKYTNESWNRTYSIQFHDHIAVQDKLKGVKIEWVRDGNMLDKKIRELF